MNNCALAVSPIDFHVLCCCRCCCLPAEATGRTLQQGSRHVRNGWANTLVRVGQSGFV